MVEMRVVLREVLRRVEFETTDWPGEAQRIRHVIIEPRRGARVRVRSVREVADDVAVTATGSCPVSSRPGAD
jgi:hypothetical protein